MDDTAADFGSMLEFDLTDADRAAMRTDRATAAPQSTEAPRGATFCSCPLHNRPDGTIAVLGRQVCGRCSHPRRPVPTRTARPVDLATEQAAAAMTATQNAPVAFAEIAAEAARNAASAGLVRGGILPSDVNPVAGYNVPVVAARGAATRYVAETVAQNTARLESEARGITAPANTTYLTAGDLIAGAEHGAIGGLVSWTGSGSLTRRAILDMLVRTGLDAALAPNPKSAHAQASKVLATLNFDGYIVRAVPAQMRKDWRARWTAARVQTGAGVGESVGAVTLVASLDAGGVLTIVDDGTDPLLAPRLIREYEARVAAEMFTAGEVTDWLGRTIRRAWRGAQLGGSWFIPSEHLDEAERFCEALSKRWGTTWMVPAIPLTTSGKLRASLASSLVREAEDVLADLQAAQIEADAGGRGIGDTKATTLVRRLEAVRERAIYYAEVLGSAEVVGIRIRVAAALVALDGVASDISQRFALIFEELAR